MARILTLKNWYPPHSRGGCEVECRDVMARLRRRGHEVEIHCSSDVRRPGLADAVKRVADPDLWAGLHRHGVTSAEHFDIERTADVFERWHVAAAEGRLDVAIR